MPSSIRRRSSWYRSIVARTSSRGYDMSLLSSLGCSSWWFARSGPGGPVGVPRRDQFGNGFLAASEALHLGRLLGLEVLVDAEEMCDLVAQVQRDVPDVGGVVPLGIVLEHGDQLGVHAL